MSAETNSSITAEVVIRESKLVVLPIGAVAGVGLVEHEELDCLAMDPL